MTKKGFEKHGFLERHIKDNKVEKIMEIGVYNGENAKNMIKTAIRTIKNPNITYYGFDTFDDTFNNNLQEVRKKLSKLNSKVFLFQGDSKDTLPQAIDDLPEMDLIFIDGEHSYETVKSDWNEAKKLMKENTHVFFHNYERSGVEKVVNNIPKTSYSVKILNPASDLKTAKVTGTR